MSRLNDLIKNLLKNNGCSADGTANTTNDFNNMMQTLFTKTKFDEVLNAIAVKLNIKPFNIKMLGKDVIRFNKNFEKNILDEKDLNTINEKLQEIYGTTINVSDLEKAWNESCQQHSFNNIYNELENKTLHENYDSDNYETDLDQIWKSKVVYDPSIKDKFINILTNFQIDYDFLNEFIMDNEIILQDQNIQELIENSLYTASINGDLPFVKFLLRCNLIGNGYEENEKEILKHLLTSADNNVARYIIHTYGLSDPRSITEEQLYLDSIITNLEDGKYIDVSNLDSKTLDYVNKYIQEIFDDFINMSQSSEQSYILYLLDNFEKLDNINNFKKLEELRDYVLTDFFDYTNDGYGYEELDESSIKFLLKYLQYTNDYNEFLLVMEKLLTYSSESINELFPTMMSLTFFEDYIEGLHIHDKNIVLIEKLNEKNKKIFYDKFPFLKKNKIQIKSRLFSKRSKRFNKRKNKKSKLIYR